MKIEPAEWKLVSRKSPARKALESMQVGQCLRIFHEESRCHHSEKGKNRNCGLVYIIWQLKKLGYNFECYHEAKSVAVVRCLKSRTS